MAVAWRLHRTRNAGADTEDEESNDDVGPMPMPKGAHSQPRHEKKKRKDRYHKRVLHHDRDMVNFVFVHMETGIESVKHCRAHMSPILGISASTDGVLSASVAEEGSAKVFDVVNFGCVLLLGTSERQAQGILAVSEQNSGTIRLYDGLGDGQPLETGESALIPHPLDDGAPAATRSPDPNNEDEDLDDDGNTCQHSVNTTTRPGPSAPMAVMTTTGHAFRRPARPSNARTQASILLLKEHFLVQLLASDLNEDDHFLLDIDNNAKQSWESKSEAMTLGRNGIYIYVDDGDTLHALCRVYCPVVDLHVVPTVTGNGYEYHHKKGKYRTKKNVRSISHIRVHPSDDDLTRCSHGHRRPPTQHQIPAFPRHFTQQGPVWQRMDVPPEFATCTNRQSPWSLQSCGYIQDPESPLLPRPPFACPDCFGAAIHTS
ncbi:hypothetical protein EDB89DRAFT_1916558 [Lactarius sanguifluus]|nr:hypothetical protein EDB89DRAFT_1916558 [Lactarius sanguifluus]